MAMDHISNCLPKTKRFIIPHMTTHPLVSSLFRIPILITRNACTSLKLKLVLHKIKMNPFSLHLLYFLSLSLLGLLLLSSLPMKNPSAPKPTTFDLFFMSVSAATVSSMDAVEMESFSNSQHVVFTLLMFFGGEVFTSMLGLLFHTLNNNNNNSSNYNQKEEQVELGTLVTQQHNSNHNNNDHIHQIIIRENSSRYLFYVVLGYMVLVHAAGFVLILVYVTLFSTPRSLLERRGIPAKTFAMFTVVSSFTNCGFLPTNDNMEAFRTCSGMLLIVAALVLLGNTMYPVGLRCSVWAFKMITKKKEHEFILNSHGEHLGYGDHLMSGWPEAGMLAATVSGFVVVQAILFGCFEGSILMEGMSSYQKAVGSVFMAVNSRHAGESIVDLSAVAPAILVLYVLMMYLPPYTTFFPMMIKEEEDGKEEDKKISLMENLMLSQISYIAIFVVIICITERRQLSEDPLNFNVFNIVFEVISAYGNVGFTTGYSCKRRLKYDGGECRDSWVGFSGRWSNKGKLVLIAVMFFGRLKKFTIKLGGKAWIIR